MGETEFDGVEFAGLGDAPAGEVARTLEETGTAVAGAHVDLDSLEGSLEETLGAYSGLGCETLVVPYLPPEQFEDPGSVREAARRLTAVAGVLDLWDVGLCYHNHDHEFVPLGDGPAFDALVEALDGGVGIELDVGWVRAAGHDPVAVLDRLDGRVPLVHLKDVDESGAPVEPGDGVVDLRACTRAARDAGAEWLVYEHDDPEDPVRSLSRGAEVLASLRDGSGG